MGPPRQSEPLNYEAILEMHMEAEPIIKKGPVNTKGLAVLCTMFMVRELEAALALRRHLDVDTKALLVTWELPVSKYDPNALGCKRTWGCSCWDPKHIHAGCPYHTALAHITILREWFGPGDAFDGLPLFPRVDGQPATPEDMLAVIEQIARLYGEELVTADGRRKFGKHSWRSTGAVFMSSIGIEVFKVQLMARWASAVVTHYTRLAPLKAITDDFRKALVGRKVEMTKGQSAKKIKKLRKALDRSIHTVAEEVKQLEDTIKMVEKKLIFKGYVINNDTGATHRVLTTINERGSRANAFCGWKYAHKDFKLTEDAPTERKATCGTCLPALRATLP